MQSVAHECNPRIKKVLTAVMCGELRRDLLFLDDRDSCQHDNDKWHLLTCHQASVINRPSSGADIMDSGGRGREVTGWATSGKMTRTQALGLLFILIFAKEPWTVDPLTMGFGKNLYLPQNRDGFSGRAFDFNIFPSSGDHFEDPFVRPVQKRFNHRPHHFSPQHVGPQHFLEIDLKFAKKKPIPGVRHLFCSGYYCAFEYASWEQGLEIVIIHHEWIKEAVMGCLLQPRAETLNVFRSLTLCNNLCYH